MLANFEHREYSGKERAWIGRYKNLHNLPHWHLECELIFIEEGAVTVSHNNTACCLSQGDAIFIESGEIHYIKGSPDSITSILMFDSALLEEMHLHVKLSSPILTHSYPIVACCREIQKELKLQQNFYELKIQGFLTSLMIDIYRQEAVTEARENRNHTSIEKYKSLIREIQEKSSYITFEEASSFMGLTKPYFSKFFKNISGMTFSHYLNIIRLEEAIKLLNHNTAGLSITEIASRCGFDTIRHFNRVFRDFTGFSPRNLPKDYVLASSSIKSMKGSFNPTLPASILLDDDC